MSRYLRKNASDHGGFATSFADLVFGLLFVFFLLAIAMVFNKPDVDAFQKKLDELKKSLDTQAKIISKAQNELSERKKEIESLKKKAWENVKTAKVASARAQLFKAQLTSIEKEKNEIQHALNEVLRDSNKLKDRIKLLKATIRADNSNFKKKLAKLKADNRKLKSKLKKLQEQNKLVARHSKELQTILNKVKQVLKQKGLTDILAEVHKMEENLKKSERKGKGRGEDELSNDSKLWVAYYPQADILSAELWYGEKLQESYDSIYLEELLRIAQELAAEYKEISVDYTELEKKEHRPRLFLRIHPDTLYSKVQDLLKELRKGKIAVSIVPWDQ